MKKLVLPTQGYWEDDDNQIVELIRHRFGDRVKVQKFGDRLYLPSDTKYRVVQWVQSEGHPEGGFYEPLIHTNYLDHRVLFQLDQMDTYKHWTDYAAIDAAFDKWEAEQAKAEEDEAWQEEAEKLVKAAFARSTSFSFKNEQGELVKLRG